MASFIFFIIFLFFVIIKKIASGKESYSQINQLHRKFYFIYLLHVLIYLFVEESSPINIILPLIVGTYIYFGLHFVYLFSLIGIAKKSISINILASIFEIESNREKPNEKNIESHMRNKKIGINDIRDNRLEQMKILNFATLEKSQFKITKKGLLVNKIGTLILTVWNQKRI